MEKIMDPNLDPDQRTVPNKLKDRIQIRSQKLIQIRNTPL